MIFCFASLCASAQTGFNKPGKYFIALNDNRDFNKNVLVAENGKIIYEKSFGIVDLTGKDNS